MYKLNRLSQDKNFADLATSKIEPAHEIMALFVLRKFIFSNTHAQPSGGARCLDFWSDPSPTSIVHVYDQRRLWRDCANAQARLSLRWSPV